MKLFFKNLWYYREMIWKKPNINQSSEKRSASYLELFFDLAFVSSISIFSRYIDYSWHNHQMFLWLLFFYFLWSVWFNITLYSDRFETSGIRYRLLLWSNMIPCLIMAFGYSQSHLIAQHYNNLLEFKGSYIFGFVASRLVMAVIYLDIIVNSSDQNSFIYQNYFFPAIGFILSPIIMYTTYAWTNNFNFTSSKFFGESIFFVTALVEFFFTTIPLFLWSQKLPRLHKTHIIDRFVLFTLIILGEIMLTSFLSLIGVDKLNYVTSVHLNLNYIYLIWRFSLTIMLIFFIWWIYTDWIGAIVYKKTKHNRKIILYSYAHFVIVIGLLFISRGLDGINTITSMVHSGHSLEWTKTVIAQNVLTDIYGNNNIYIYTRVFNIGAGLFLTGILLIMFTTNLKFTSQNFEANNHEVTLWISIVTAIVIFFSFAILSGIQESKNYTFFFEINIYISLIIMLYLIIIGIIVWILYFQREMIAGVDKNQY